MSHLQFFAFKIALVELVRLHLNGHLINKGESVSFKTHHLLGIVRQEPHFLNADSRQYLGTDAVVSHICVEAELFICLDRVKALVLQCISFQFVHQADPPPFLPEIDNNARAFIVHHFHCAVQLSPAITTKRAENISCHTFGMDADKDRFVRFNIPLDQHNVEQIVQIVFIYTDFKIPCIRRGNHDFRRRLIHERFGTHPILNHIRNGTYPDTMFFAEFFERRHSGHGAVIVHDFTDHACRFQAAKSRQIHRPFCLPCPNHHTSLSCSQGKDMPRSDKIARLGIIRNSSENRGGAIRGRDTRCHAAARFYGHGKTGMKG